MSSFKSLFDKKYNSIRPTAFIVKVKRNLNGELDDLKSITKFLDAHYENPPITQRITHYVKSDFSAYSCPVCNKPLLYREKPNPGYHKTCGNADCRNTQNYLSTQKAMQEKYGVENISQTSLWREKVKATNLDRRGVEWNTQTQKLIEARQESWQKNKEAQLEKRYETNIQRYGVEHVTQSDEVKRKVKESMKTSYEFSTVRLEKIKDTQQEKYGSYYCATPECQDKKYQRKDYVFPSGKVVKVQGYEPRCLDELLAQGYTEEDIVVGNVEIEQHIGKITYLGKDGQEHRYYPDIYLLPKKQLIEVKSWYTLSKDKEINRKHQAVLDLGYDYLLKVY